MIPKVLRTNNVYRRIFTSSALSSFGDLFDMFAMMTLLTYYWKSDPIVIAVIPLTYALPSILLSQLAGIIVDRYNKLRVIIISEAIGAFFTLFLIFVNRDFIALVLLTLRSIATVFKNPAQQSLVRNVVEEEHILQATSLQNIIFQISKVISPFIGGAILAVTSPKICILINFITYILAMILLLNINRINRIENTTFHINESTNRKNSFFSDVIQGWKLIFLNKIVLLAVFIFHTSYFIVMMVDAQISVFLREILPNKPEVLGWLLSGLGLGAFLVGIYLSNKKYIKSPMRLCYCGLILFGGTLVFASYFDPVNMPHYSIIVAAPIGGAGVGINLILFNYILQINSDKENLGKVYGVVNTLTSIILILAPLLGATVVKVIGARLTFNIAGYITCGIGIISLLASAVISGYEKSKQTRDTTILEKGGGT